MLTAVRIVLAVVVLFAVSLVFREQELPKSWVEALAERLSGEAVFFRCDGASIGFRRGLSVNGIEAYEQRGEGGIEKMASVRSLSLNPLKHELRVTGLRYRRLPESYYMPGFEERSAPLEANLPDLPEMRLVLDDVDVLGINAERVSAQLCVRRNLIALDEIHLEWPGGNRHMALDGFFRLDFAEQRAHGEVRGLATQPHIRPLLVALDVPSAFPYFDAFTEVPAPVTSYGEFDVNLINNDFHMRLDLRPELGKYNAVPMSRAQGVLDLSTQIRDTNCFVRLKVELPMALDTKGRQLYGSLGVNLTNEFVRVDFNAVSKLAFNDIMRIVDVIEPETLALLVDCETAPEITAIGHIGTCAEDSGWNALAGSGRLWRGSIMDFKVRNLSFDYEFDRETLSFQNVRATGKCGGDVQGEAKIFMPGFDEDKMTFAIHFDHKGGMLNELADIFGVDLAGRDGKLDASVQLEGAIGTNVLSTLNGSGSINVRDGHLLQMKLFAGLTEQLADWVPGVGYIVNQSQASADFTVSNGVFRTENFFIEGGLVSIKGWGTYDAAGDELDMTVRVQFLRNESLLGTIVHPVTWPFTKLLLEFRATGSIDDPKWQYISVLDRIF